ncbi:hypothetical protein KDD17_08285 [Sulfitobacter albidus]|uniref:Uncharacterized protein n=1 Tax=Sulfitobacter albidus TaxID=2829501 RepID=A0A975JBF4_9RHOB|nr:hypothetical protein [Sulfitobacter albidus]QUJ75045.1 hypothetical protein KDD17_08285 [Sulfitobacter albidus]
MGFFRNIFDGLLSFAACLATLAAFGLPTWATHQAITYGLVPAWVYVALVAMIYVGGNLAIAFLRKALDGVAPLRERKRR